MSEPSMPMHTDVKVQKNKQQMKHNCTYIMYILCVLLFLVLYRHVSSVLSCTHVRQKYHSLGSLMSIICMQYIILPCIWC